MGTRASSPASKAATEKNSRFKGTASSIAGYAERASPFAGIRCFVLIQAQLAGGTPAFPVNALLLPAGSDAVWQHKSGRFNFLDFPASDFENVHGGHVKNALVGRHFHAVDFRGFKLAVVE